MERMDFGPVPVAALGEMLWDMLPGGRRPGGAPANFACHMAAFGCESWLVSAVGHDEAGDELTRFFAAKGVNLSVSRVERPTGRVEVALDEAGVPRYEIVSDVAWDHIPFTEREAALARRVRCACFGTLAQRSPVSRRTIDRFLDSMPGDALRVFDINLRASCQERSVVEQSLVRCNVLKMNDEELPEVCALFGREPSDPESDCRRLMADFDIGWVILTGGARESAIFTPEGVSRRDTPSVVVADTVGAGDSFTAAFCAGLLRGLSLREIHRLAVDTAAFVCGSEGATPSLPKQLTDRLAG